MSIVFNLFPMSPIQTQTIGIGLVVVAILRLENGVITDGVIAVMDKSAPTDQIAWARRNDWCQSV
jgi:hypothetical protein